MTSDVEEGLITAPLCLGSFIARPLAGHLELQSSEVMLMCSGHKASYLT